MTSVISFNSMLKQILSVTLALSLTGVGSSAEDSFETCEIPAGEVRCVLHINIHKNKYIYKYVKKFLDYSSI
jgi:hypothetical protein